MNEQAFGTKLFEASVHCINIAGVAHCLTSVNQDDQMGRSWLNPAMCELASAVERLSEKLTELEEEFHLEGKFK